MITVLGLAFDGCQASGLMSTFDVFNVINTIWKQQNGGGESLYDCRLVSIDGGEVCCSNGTRMLTEYTLDSAPDASLIVIPGIHHKDTKSLTRSLQQLQKEAYWLEGRFSQNDELMIAANCSGVFLLAENGMLQGEECTTAWWLGGFFGHRYPDVSLLKDTTLAQAGRVYTTGSMTANIGLMLQIAEKQVGRQLSQSAARTMLIDATHNPAAPYMFLQEQSSHQDSLILSVESQLQRDISQALDLDQLAEQHAVSSRTLSRRFKKANGISLSEYVQDLRFEQARLLLETTSLTIEQLIERVGYTSASSLSRMFKQRLGQTPNEYRREQKKAS